MKKLFLFTAVLFLTAFTAFADDIGYKCVTMEELEKQKKENPQLEAQMQAFEEQTQLWIKNHYKKGGKNQIQAGLGDEIVIPIVVHVLYNTVAQFKNPEIVTEQILEICNNDYAAINPNPMYPFDESLRDNTKIRFVMAHRAPDGSEVKVTYNGIDYYGIEYRNTYIYEFPQANWMKYTKYGGLDAWDPNLYFNVWVCNTPGAVCWAQFPTLVNENYGVVVDHQVFGIEDGNYASHNGGHIATHEIGHCFNLRHTWGDDSGACTGTDYCDDTPNEADSHYGNYTIEQRPVFDDCTTSGLGVMVTNFMDYTWDNTLANFTPDQTARMWACFTSGAPLEPLLSSTVATFDGSCTVPSSLYVKNIQTSNAELHWSGITSANSYNVRFRKVGTSTWNMMSTSTNSALISGLSKLTSYECQVQSVCASGSSDFSFSTTFKTLKRDATYPSILDAPALVSPSNGETVDGNSPELSWEYVNGVQYYNVLISEYSDFSSCYETIITALHTSSNLKENTTYYWKVKAIYEDIESDWSEVYSFTTTTVQYLAPNLQYPPNNARGVALDPYLYWYLRSGATKYNLQYSTNSSFPVNETITYEDIPYNYYFQALSGLKLKTSYYWRVNAEYGDLTSEWSVVWKFTTTLKGKFSIPEENEIVLKNASLSFNPNPFSSKATFKLNVFESDNVKIVVTDLLGREVSVLVSESMKPGEYTYDFDGSMLGEGVYYCHLLTGNEIQTLKMVIVK